MKTEVPVKKTPKSLLHKRIPDPFGLLEEFERNWLFPTDWTSRTPTMATTWRPMIDMFRKDENLVIRAELPGMKRDDITVKLDRDHLVLEGRRSLEESFEDKDIVRTERAYGAFHRMIPLGFEPKGKKVRAAYTDGVLEITIPVPETLRNEPERIAIE